MRVYPYGVNQDYTLRAARESGVGVRLVDDLGQADMLLTLKSYYRKRPAKINEAERRGIPVYVLRSNTLRQLSSCLAEVFGVEARVDPLTSAMKETQEAIAQVLAGAPAVELTPQNSYLRRQQHEMARQANLLSRSLGKEPRRRVMIYHEKG
jgi:hypothetical protein